MRKYILLSAVLSIILTALTACYDVGGATTVCQTSVTNTVVASELEDYAYQAAHNQAVHTTSWQEAYAGLINYYAQQPATTADILTAEWRFMLHDINQSGTPQLFFVRYHDGLVNFHTVYSFEYGEAILVKSSLSMNSMFAGGMYVAPGGVGVVRYLTTGFVSHYDKFGFSGAVLSLSVNGDVSPMVESFRVRTFPATEDEFEDVFGCSNDRLWLDLYVISEDNVRDIIFEWQQLH